MIILQNISYIHPNKDLLFDHVNLTVNRQDKTALIGNNGAGKSTLLKIIAGELQPSGGQLSVSLRPYYVPQIFGQYNHLTIAQALNVEGKLKALREILDGNVTEENYRLLEDDWTIEDRCREALLDWQLSDLEMRQRKFFSRAFPFIDRNWFCWMNRPIIWMFQAGNFYQTSFRLRKIRFL